MQKKKNIGLEFSMLLDRVLTNLTEILVLTIGEKINDILKMFIIYIYIFISIFYTYWKVNVLSILNG